MIEIGNEQLQSINRCPMDDYSKNERWFCNIVLFRFSKLLEYESASNTTDSYYRKAGRRFETYTINRLIVYLVIIGVVSPLLVCLLSVTINAPLYSWIVFVNKYQEIEYSRILGNITTILIFLIPLFGMLFINQINRMEKRVEQINEAMRALYDRFENKMVVLRLYGGDTVSTKPLVNVDDCRSLMEQILMEYRTRDAAIRNKIIDSKNLAEHSLENSFDMEGKINFIRYIIGNSLAILTVILLISILLMFVGKPIYALSYWGIYINSVKSVIPPSFIYALIISVLSFIKALYL